MRGTVWVLVALSAILLAAACGTSDGTVATLPTRLPEPASALESGTTGSTPVCPAASGAGTVSPAVSIYSTTFMVNGVEQVVRRGDRLQAMPGDEVWVKEATICTLPFSGNGGEACVDFVPVDRSGEEIVSKHSGSHVVQVTAGFVSIPGPGDTWTIDESWDHIAAVVNHWPPEDTEDPGCADRQCEHDDRIVVELR